VEAKQAGPVRPWLDIADRVSGGSTPAVLLLCPVHLLSRTRIRTCWPRLPARLPVLQELRGFQIYLQSPL
jgi:hypothetical protein